MTLSEELQRVREYQSGPNPPPASEANTCSWVIRPLLHNCGYSHHEIDEQAHDGAGNIPDFTLLPNTPHTWFLEAKKWTVALADAHVNQAINYANIQGKRWVVLSNGREWRLYDNYLNNVPPAERLVTVAKLDCGAELEELLAALSKASVQSGALEKYAVQTRFTSLLDAQLKAPNSEVIAAIRAVLRTKFGLSSVTPADIVAYFHSPTTVSVPTSPPISTDPLPASPAVTTPVAPQIVPTDGMTLRELLQAGKSLRGRSPKTLIVPDGSTMAVSSWAKLASHVAEWLFANHAVPALPFSGQSSGNYHFINTTPHQANGAPMRCREIVAKGQTLYVHTDKYVEDFVIALNALCEEVGESPDGFKVTLK